METNYDLEKIWSGVIDSLRLSVSAGTMNMYLIRTELLNIRPHENRVICQVGCEAFVRDIVEKRFIGQLADELTRIIGKPAEIVLSAKQTQRKVSGQQPSDNLGPLFQMPKADPSDWRKAKLKERSTFEHYAVGGSNQMAFAAAQAVAKKPGSTYNPLLIHGGVGVGKTHLMQAIGHAVITQGESRVLFCTSEEFTNDLVEGIKNKSTDHVRAKYRRLKLLMIDDVQFIAGKGSAQEEFFHTFNAIAADGGQIVMTSDRPPAEIPKLEERLRSRFGAGLIVDIEQPDMELRAAILLIKAGERGLVIDMATAQLIAEYIDGVRELEGFLSRLVTEQEIGKPATYERVEALLKVSQPRATLPSRIVTPQDVILNTVSYYGVGISQLKGERRTKTVAWPRQILMYFLCHEMKLPLSEVGRLLGGRDHSTVLHARDKVLAELGQNETFRVELHEARKKIFTPIE